MIHKFLIFGILFFIYGFQTKLYNKCSRIYWNEGHTLVWSDFIGNVPSSSPNGAISNVGIDPQINYSNGIFEAEIKSFFCKDKSWSKVSLQTGEALEHEQGHFDIAEIYARKLRKLLIEGKYKKNNIKKKYEEVFSKISKELTEYQDLYDKETDHHKNRTKQLEWNKRLVNELEELKVFENTHLVIKCK